MEREENSSFHIAIFAREEDFFTLVPLLPKSMIPAVTYTAKAAFMPSSGRVNRLQNHRVEFLNAEEASPLLPSAPLLTPPWIAGETREDTKFTPLHIPVISCIITLAFYLKGLKLNLGTEFMEMFSALLIKSRGLWPLTAEPQLLKPKYWGPAALE